jgi:hypothetical protein
MAGVDEPAGLAAGTRAKVDVDAGGRTPARDASPTLNTDSATNPAIHPALRAINQR